MLRSKNEEAAMSSRSDDLLCARDALQEARGASNTEQKLEKVIEALERLIKIHDEQERRKDADFALGG